MQFMKRFLPTASDAEISAADAAEKLKSAQPPFLLDVRQPDEYREGHIAGATLIPLDDLRGRMGELPTDRQIVVVCRSGARSGVAAGWLKAAGYDVVNLSGGMIAWRQAGQTISR
jgi:rhodanese-related sulfurtransferase